MTWAPQRSRTYGVGKEIGGAVYVHRSAEQVLGPVVDEARQELPEDFEYHVVKFVPKTGLVSFVQSPDFNAADEPTVGEIVTVSPDGSTRRRAQSSNPEIYHHKWLFVNDDYVGFDVDLSKRRSRAWLALEDVDKTRIGRRKYWESEILPRLNPTENEKQQGKEDCQLRLATWNLELASPASRRIDPIRRRLASFEADVCVLTEVDLRTVEDWPYFFESGRHATIRNANCRKVAIVSRHPIELVDPVGSPRLPRNNFIAVDVLHPRGRLRVVGLVIRWNQKAEYIEALPEALEATVTARTILAGDFNLKVPGPGLSKRLVEVFSRFGLETVTAGEHPSLGDERPLNDHIGITGDLAVTGLTVWPRRDPTFEDGAKEVTDHASSAVTVSWEGEE